MTSRPWKRPGWIEPPDDEMRADVDAVTGQARWVVEGNYDRVMNDLRKRADLVVWLDLPLRTTFPRVLVRTFRRLTRGETICNGNRESLRMALLTRESILVWAVRSHRPHRRRSAQELAARPHVS